MSAHEVVLHPRGVHRVRSGHPFIWERDVLAPPGAMGDVVRMVDGKGVFLGMALFAAGSRIALRVLSREERMLDEELVRERIAKALLRRQRVLGERDAYRVVHGEADLLPGLFIDRYGEAVVLQTAARAMDARKEMIGKVVRELLGPALIVCRDDGSMRDMDGLPRQKDVLYGGPGTVVRFHDAGSLMEADLFADGKTGSFLDQQDNHAAALALASMRVRGHEQGRALDAFTYHGGFALSLARAGMQVLACDESQQAIARARENAALNMHRASVDFQVDNAFSLLRRLEAGGERFDIVVLDPPALAKRGSHGPAQMDSALRAYKELNLRGLRLLEPGGVLLTCSCSGKLSPADFEAMLVAASGDAGRAVRILERRGAGQDHPVLLGVPETEYLKCWVLEAVA